jgi:hypothetical protein
VVKRIRDEKLADERAGSYLRADRMSRALPRLDSSPCIAGRKLASDWHFSRFSQHLQWHRFRAILTTWPINEELVKPG